MNSLNYAKSKGVTSNSSTTKKTLCSQIETDRIRRLVKSDPKKVGKSVYMATRVLLQMKKNSLVIKN